YETQWRGVKRVNSLAPLLDRLTTAGARLAATRARVQEGEPWPVGSQRRGETEGEWGPTEVLAHVAEMLQYWLGELERVIAAPTGAGGAAPPFGRIAADDIRTLSVARDATLPARELFDRIETSLGRYRRRLPGLTET